MKCLVKLQRYDLQAPLIDQNFVVDDDLGVAYGRPMTGTVDSDNPCPNRPNDKFHEVILGKKARTFEILAPDSGYSS